MYAYVPNIDAIVLQIQCDEKYKLGLIKDWSHRGKQIEDLTAIESFNLQNEERFSNIEFIDIDLYGNILVSVSFNS